MLLSQLVAIGVWEAVGVAERRGLGVAPGVMTGSVVVGILGIHDIGHWILGYIHDI